MRAVRDLRAGGRGARAPPGAPPVCPAQARVRVAGGQIEKIVLKNSSDPTLTCLYRLYYRVKKREKMPILGDVRI